MDSGFFSAHSKVFEDISCLPQGSTMDAMESRRCNVAESEQEIEMLLVIMKGNPDATYTLPQLVLLTELADKYDCHTVASVIKNRLWWVRTYIYTSFGMSTQ